MRLGASRALALVLLATITLWAGRAGLPPIDRDESRYAQATRQMLQSGDWLDIRFQDQPRYVQPVGAYWAQAVAVSLAGDATREIWPHRLPSWLAGVIAVVLTGWIGARLVGTEAGTLGAALLAASLLFNFEARIATTDAMLLACVLAGQAALVSLWRGAKDRWVAAAFWASVGAGMLTKGPVAMLPLAGTLIGLAVTERRARWMLRLRPLMGLAIVVAMVGPWVAAIEARSHGAFLATALGHNLLGKAAGTQEAHGGPPGYHLLVFALGFWPGSILAVRGAPAVWRERRRPEVAYLLSWIVPAWAVIELAGTKLPHYGLPLYPAVALLTARFVREPVGSRRWRPVFLALVAVWSVAGLVAALGPGVAARWLEGRWPIGALTAGVVAAAGVAVAARLLARGDARRAAMAMVAAAVLAYGGAFGLALPALRTIWISPRLVATAERSECAAPTLLVASYAEPSLVFLAPGPVVFVDPGAAASLLARTPCGVATVAARDRAPFVAAAGAVQLLGEVAGLDYSNGKRVDLLVFGTADTLPAR